MVRGLGRGGAVLLLLLTLLPAHRTQEPSYRYVFYDGDEAEYDSPQVRQEKHTYQIFNSVQFPTNEIREIGT